MNSKEFIDDLLSAKDEFSPVPFWFFNDEPDEGRVREQFKDYVNKGVNALVLHPRIGVPESIPYLSEAFFDAVKMIVRVADELKMKIVLYDEGMYPSGSAHGQVVAFNPDFAAKGMRFDGDKLVYEPSGGTIRGIHFGEDDGENAPAAADILNPAAVDKFIELTHDAYYANLKEYFGNTIIAFFTDEPCPLGRNAGRYRDWYPGLDKDLEALGGKVEDLKALFVPGAGNDSTRLYRKLIKKRLREVFYSKLSNWCVSHGIALMGHPEVSDDVEEEFVFQIPGQDLIMRRVAQENKGLYGIDSVQAKLPGDIARITGARRNANECFGVCNRYGIPWFFKAEDMLWDINWLLIRGVNLLVPHAFYYSIAGKRKDERPPDVGQNNIWWPEYKKISDYIKRLCYVMTDSVNTAEVAVLCDNNNVPSDDIAVLYETQTEFNYVPAALLTENNARVENDRLIIGNNSYKTVINLIGAKLPAFLGGFGGLRDNTEEFCKKDSLFFDVRKTTVVKNGRKITLLSNEGKKTVEYPLEGIFGESYTEIDFWNNDYCVRNSKTVQLRPLQIMGITEPSENAKGYDMVKAVAEAKRDAAIFADGRWILNGCGKEDIRVEKSAEKARLMWERKPFEVYRITLDGKEIGVTEECCFDVPYPEDGDSHDVCIEAFMSNEYRKPRRIPEDIAYLSIKRF